MDASLIREVWRRAGSRCEYCHLRQEFDDRPFEVDHIRARKHEGLTVAGNLALSLGDAQNAGSWYDKEHGADDYKSRRELLEPGP
jgi:hypothetical protein